MKTFVAIIFGVLLPLSFTAFAEQGKDGVERENLRCESPDENNAGLQSYEPNTVGLNKDEHFDSHLDFKLSVKYPMRDYASPAKGDSSSGSSSLMQWRLPISSNSRDSKQILPKDRSRALAVWKSS